MDNSVISRTLLSTGELRMKKKSKSNQRDYEREAAICKAFANPTRLQLVAMLERGDRWSAQLQAGLGISKANLSQHLGILKSAGLVSHSPGR